MTLARTFLIVPILFLLNTDRVWLAFLCVLFHDYLDHVDGIVAKAQRTMGHSDDPLLGSFLDAFCDKIVINISLIGVLMRTRFSACSYLSLSLYFSVVLAVMAYEIILAVVRVEDYYVARFSSEKRELAASMEGKLKEKLESVGLACLCLASASEAGPLASFSGWVGIACFALTLRFAHASLAHKLSAWAKPEEKKGN